MKRFSAALAICLLAAGVSVAAPSVTIDRIDGTYPPSPLSGEFRLTPNSELADQLGSFEAFQSFCLEMYAPISMNTTYAAYVNDEAVSGGNATVYGPDGGDPISPATAYLYTQFRNESLLGYDYDDGRVGSAYALQSAIWYLEEEYISEEGAAADYASFNNLTKQFITEALNSGWTTTGDVVVLNLTNGKASYQDMLALATVPAPGAILLSSLGLGLVGWLKRRNAM